MNDPFTLRVYVPSGDAEGARIVDRMNWTGRGYFVSRDHWPEIRKRDELRTGGIYVLIGYTADELGAEQPIAYVGQTDNLRKRIDQHDSKEFWSTAALFLSPGDGLNRAHTTWLEWALLEAGMKAKRCHFLNAISPAEPMLIESEKADTRAFLHEMLRMMPTMNVHIFSPARTITPLTTAAIPVAPSASAAIKDVVIVPAQREGFDSAFLGAHAWWAIRIAAKHRDHLKWIAAYQVTPISAVTHIAAIDHLEPFGDEGKFKVVFAGAPMELPHPIPFATAMQGAMQGPRYTDHATLLAAQTVADLT